MSSPFDDFAVERGAVEIEGQSYPYVVLRDEFQPDLPGFVGIVNGELLIATSTPKQYREYIFWHEVTCVLKRDRQNCAQTVREELERVPLEIRRAYTEYRCAFFLALLNFYHKQRPEFYPQIEASYQYLREALKG